MPRGMEANSESATGREQGQLRNPFLSALSSPPCLTIIDVAVAFVISPPSPLFYHQASSSSLRPSSGPSPLSFATAASTSFYYRRHPEPPSCSVAVVGATVAAVVTEQGSQSLLQLASAF
ncbi:hypothetical protein PIB30_076935 [Stylosanthes scabra]|uniref:Uncharacterized protein n=1 Tax=Stylosanthes scabra TaxID=79078 RepID=A0ABU6RQS7_9FABA|nr:hypothetical protein [Stylosanthes scabra]